MLQRVAQDGALFLRFLVLHESLQHRIHPRLVTLAHGLEEIINVRIDTDAHGDFGFEVDQFGIGPVEVKWNSIRIIGDGTTDVIFCQRIKSSPIKVTSRKTPKVFDR